ncbi:hypothetical protein LVJ94_18305 [Pendulispora rubella]|uniref:Uncharacterized protein n=1 Tax=Pendulispora rubella TaxID=2741070 RepID=A0ABZ2LFL7_9BACT
MGLVAPLCVAQKANAQEWLKDRRYQEGIGVRTGDFELHPGIAAEVGYDSNWFLRSHKVDGTRIANGEPNVPVQEGALLRITPSINFSTLGPQRRAGDTDAAAKPTVTFRGGLSATYREFFGPQRLRDQRNVSATANLRLDILPDRPIGFGIEGLYTRTIQPNTTGDPDQSFNRNDIDGKVELITVPGGGTLDWRFGYGLHATLFENSAAVPYNNITHEAYTKGRWKFRPRTAFLYDGSARFRNYLSDADRATVRLFDSTPVRARLGINGLITSRFAFLGMVGWGASFSRPASLPQVKQYNSVIGQAEFKFFLTPAPGDADAGTSLLLSSIAIGYTRDFQSSYLGSHYGSDRGYAKMQYMFAGRVLLSLEGGVAALTYPDLYYPDFAPAPQANSLAQSAWTDIRADATLFAEYRFSNSFGVNTTFIYTTNISDTRLPINSVPQSGTAGGDLYDLNYRRFQAFLGVRWFL